MKIEKKKIYNWSRTINYYTKIISPNNFADLKNILDIKSLKTDIKKNLNKLLDKLSGKQQDSSKKESIGHKKIIKNLKDLF